MPQVAALRALHYKSQTVESEAKLCQMGLDLVEGRVRNNVEAGVLEPAMSKIKMIQVRRSGGAWKGDSGAGLRLHHMWLGPGPPCTEAWLQKCSEEMQVVVKPRAGVGV